MARDRIQPDRITRPFQLLAAWLVTLIVLDGAFLTGAQLIREPTWIPAMLSSVAVANVPIFLGSMFLLQTRFRAEMQDDRYYSTYLEQRQETSRVAIELTERMATSGLDIPKLGHSSAKVV